MKKILHVGNNLKNKQFNPSYISQLGPNLEKEGFSIVYTSGKINKYLRLFDMLTTVLKVLNKVDIVLIDTYSTTNFYFAFLISQLCRILKKDYIPILHGGNLPMRLKNSPFMCRLLFTKAKLNVSPSMYLVSQFERAGYKNLKCIPNAVNVENYPFKERDNKTIKILWVRSLATIYNPELALQVLTNLKIEGLDVSLTMVGPDREGILNSLKSMVIKNKLDVTFTGKLSMAEWTKLSETHHIFLNTSNFDNMPLSIIEAMLLGLPVISTNVGGIPYLIEDKKEGVLCNSADANCLTNAIKTVLTNKEFLNTIALNARKKAELLDWENVKGLWISALS